MTHFSAADVPKLARYWKAVVAALGAAVVIGNEVVEAVSTGYGDGTWQANDTVTAVIAVATAAGVYAKSNAAPKPKPVSNEASTIGEA